MRVALLLAPLIFCALLLHCCTKVATIESAKYNYIIRKMSRRNGRAKRGDRRCSPPVAPPPTNRNPLTGIFRPRNRNKLRIAGGYPLRADFFSRTRKDPARCFEHPRGPCLTYGRTSDCTTPLEDDAIVRPRSRASRLREDRRGPKGAVAWLPRAPRFSPARHVSPQRVSQKGRMMPLLPPNFANVTIVPPLPQSPSFIAETLVNGGCSRTYAQVTAQGNTGDTA